MELGEHEGIDISVDGILGRSRLIRKLIERVDDLEAQVSAMRRVREHHERMAAIDKEQPRLARHPSMTPLEIEVLLHCYLSPKPHPRADAPAVQATLAKFIDNGLIEVRTAPEYDYYVTTEKGDKLIYRLCSVPWPETE